MKKQSAGILLYRQAEQGYEVLLAHPGGPFWATKDAGSWSMPKGELDKDEKPLEAAKREFQEEVGMPAPAGEYIHLGEAKQSSGKIVHAWACEADLNLEGFSSNMFEMEWPPKSGQTQEFPENDKIAWVPMPEAKRKVVKGQVSFLEALAEKLGQTLDEPTSHSPQISLF
ncbi:MAG TPA: NUDIX domain-containing protein [Candidatus Saccharimonadales bacterium]|nr:NUDIX domain-containing protein [Candidatus Saccharimonadales bacterium]